MKLSAALLLLLAAGPASAQSTPIPRSDFEEAAAQYRSYALGEFQEVVDAWVAAVNSPTPGDASRLYTDDAYVDMGEIARGRKEAGALLESWRADIRRVEVGLSDFDASGNMAYGTLQARISPRTGSTETATVLLVMRKVRGDWRIRAQTIARL